MDLKSINFQSFSASLGWCGYFEGVSHDLESIKPAANLVETFFAKELKDAFLLSALAYNDIKDPELEKDYQVYDDIYLKAKEKGFLQEETKELINYYTNDAIDLPAKIINLQFEKELILPFCELVMSYYFVNVVGEICFIIMPSANIALYPHDDVGFGCIDLGGASDILYEFLEYCNNSKKFISHFNA